MEKFLIFQVLILILVVFTCKLTCGSSQVGTAEAASYTQSEIYPQVVQHYPAYDAGNGYYSGPIIKSQGYSPAIAFGGKKRESSVVEYGGVGDGGYDSQDVSGHGLLGHKCILALFKSGIVMGVVKGLAISLLLIFPLLFINGGILFVIKGILMMILPHVKLPAIAALLQALFPNTATTTPNPNIITTPNPLLTLPTLPTLPTVPTIPTVLPGPGPVPTDFPGRFNPNSYQAAELTKLANRVIRSDSKCLERIFCEINSKSYLDESAVEVESWIKTHMARSDKSKRLHKRVKNIKLNNKDCTVFDCNPQIMSNIRYSFDWYDK